MTDALERLRRVTEVAEELVGSCRELSSVATEEEMNDGLFLRDLDARVMLCEGCGWWDEADLMDGAGNCGECQEGEYD